MKETTSMPEGGKEMLILCNRINQLDIKVRFFNDIWEHFASFDPDEIHMKCAITLKIPPYKDHFLTKPKEVWVQLVEKDGSASKPVRFVYMANMSELARDSLQTCQKPRVPANGFKEMRCDMKPEQSPTSQHPKAGSPSPPLGNYIT